MNITIQPINSAQAKMKILVPAAQVSARMDSYYSGLAKRAKVPGFRPGKAPKDVVKKLYASESSSEIAERLVSEFVIQAIQDRKLELIYPPTLLATDLPDETKDFSFEVELDLKPQIPDLNLAKLSIEDIAPKPVADEELATQLEHLRESDANFNDIQEARAAQDGDYVVIRFEGSVDGVKTPQLASESQSFVLGKREFLPEFEEAIVGLKVGEKRTFNLTFPKDYHAAEMQNKTAIFEVEVKGIKEKALPALDDAFAKAVNPEIQTLDQLKADIKKELEAQRDRMRKSALREKIGDALVERHPFEVSKRQVEQLAAHLAEEAHHMMHKMGVEHQENEEHFKALQESSFKKATRDIQLSYILQKIAQEQKITVEDSDIDKRFEELTKKTGFSLTQIQKYYAGKDEDASVSRLDRLKVDILDEKSLDSVLSQATIKNKGS